MLQAAGAARALESQHDDVYLMRALETAIVVCYWRPFSASNKIGGLADKWAPQGDRHSELHRTLRNLRNQAYAHTDETSGRIGDVRPLSVGDQVHHVTGESWWAFPREWIPEIVKLCIEQSVRFIKAAEDIAAELHDEG
jgi:hypothetical protein